MIVDDQDFNLNTLEIILKYKLKVDIKTTCTRATSGKMALDILKEDVVKNKYNDSSYKLILMDYEMPEMDGLETTKQIREFLYQEGIDQPIIACITGHSDEKYINNAIKAGMNIVYAKSPLPESNLQDLMIKC